MSDPGQEREALEELVRVKDLEEAMGALPIEYNRMKAAAWEKARTALAAREEPQGDVVERVTASKIRDGDYIWFDLTREFRVVVGRKQGGYEDIGFDLDDGPDDVLETCFQRSEFVLRRLAAREEPQADEMVERAASRLNVELNNRLGRILSDSEAGFVVRMILVDAGRLAAREDTERYGQKRGTLDLIRNLANALETKEDAQDPLQDAADEALLSEADMLLDRHGMER